MEVEGQHANGTAETAEERGGISPGLRWALIILNCILMALGNTGGPLLLRLYFLRGGSRQWFSSWIETGGWPVILFPLFLSYLCRRRSAAGRQAELFLITPQLFLACAALGLLTGLDDFLYAYGLEFVPVSTSSLLISSQLAFTAVFAFVLVRQRFTAFSVNAVALLTVGAVLLGLHVGGDRPAGESRARYWLGFVLTLGAAALHGLLLPLVEVVYQRTRQVITYTLVMEMQMVMSFFATAFCSVGMLVNKDFQAIPSEASHYELGVVRYYVVLIWDALFWQFFFLGNIGVIYYVNTLLAGIINAVFIPVTEVLAVIFFHENFGAEKSVALALSLWGLASYLYGEYKGSKEKPATDAGDAQDA